MTFRKYSLFVLFIFICSLSTAQKLYVAENGAQQLSRSNPDGSLPEIVSAAGDIGNILDIAVDPVTNKVYWIENSALLSTVRRAPVVSQGGTVKLGTGEIFVQIPLSLLNAFEAMTIDPVARELYVTNSSAGSIFKVSLEATPPITTLPLPLIGSLLQAYGIDVDPINSKMYFINNVLVFGRQIQKANLNGSGASAIVTSTGTLQDVAVDPAGGNIYFTSNVSGNGQVYKADLNGGNKMAIVTGLSSSIKGIALDSKNGFVYWATTSGTVGRARLDGSNATTIRSALNSPNYVALDLSTTIPPKLYWTQGTLQEIHRINTNGTDFEQYHAGVGPGANGLAVARNSGYVYWTDGTSADVKRGQIGETGFQTNTTLVNLTDGTPGIGGTALDETSDVLYFANTATGTVQKINVSDPPLITPQTIITPPLPPYAVALDPIQGKIYYTTNFSIVFGPGVQTVARLYRANMDGSNQEMLIESITNTNPGPRYFYRDVKVDPIAGKVYWSVTDNNTPGKIHVANISNVAGTEAVLLSTPGEPRGIELDVFNSKIYWADRGATSPVVAPSIMSANLDGSAQQIVRSIATGQPPNFIALDPGVCTIPPTANAGVDVTVCPFAPFTLAGAVTGSVANTIWTSSGTGSFSDPASLTSSYTPSADDLTAGTVVLTLAAQPAGPCLPGSDQLILTINSPIAAGDVSLSAPLGQTSNIDPLAVSTINTGDIIVATLTQLPTKGTATLLADNTIDFTPDNGTVGSDWIEYQICNQCGLCDLGSIAVDIPNLAPVIIPVAPVSTTSGASVTISFVGLLSDPNNNLDPASFSIVTPPVSGAVGGVVGSDITIDYIGLSFIGNDNFTVQVCDLLNVCTTSNISILVSAINNPPTPTPPSVPIPESESEVTPTTEEIIVYNGISPNGDGVNDYFKINNIQFLEPENKVTIYNRWGDKVFEMENYNSNLPERRFEGRQNSGKELPSGVYFYKVEFTSGRTSLNGYLTLKK